MHTEHRHRGEDDIPARIFRALAHAPAWAGSALVHVLLLLLVFSLPGPWDAVQPPEDFSVGLEKDLGAETALFRGDDYSNDPEDASDPLLNDNALWNESETAKDEDLDRLVANATVQPKFTNTFEARGHLGREEAVRGGGATKGSEEAVERGLDWLRRHQNADGSWSPANYHTHCDRDAGCGKGEGGYQWMDPACTGLGLMCFLGAGYTGEQRTYRSTVNRAIDYLLRIQRSDGRYMKHTFNRIMYNHAIATLALSEAYAMTRRSDIRRSVERAVRFIASEQNDDGGWRYSHKMHPRSDTSVTGWVVMAIKSAKLADIQVPANLFEGSEKWLDFATDPKTGFVGYTGPGNTAVKVPSTTAIAMLCRQFLGTPRSDERIRTAAAILHRFPPNFGDAGEANIYYYYYAMLALYQYGGEPWEYWNPRVRDPLVKTQETRGCARGSWRPSFYWASRSGSAPGRVYSTTMAILTLEVYYRYLPIYRANEGLSEIDKALIAYKEALERYKDFLGAAGTDPPDPAALAGAAGTAEGAILKYLSADRSIADLTDKQKTRRDSRLAASNMRLAAIYLHLSRHDECLALLDHVEKAYPKFAGSGAVKRLRLLAYGDQARRLAERGQPDRAALQAKRIVEIRYKDLIRTPEQPFNTYLWVANQFYHQKDYVRAAEVYQSLVERFGKSPEHAGDIAKLKPVLAKCRIEAMEWRKALALLEELRRGQPNSAPILRDTMTCLRELNRHDDALEVGVQLRNGFPAGSEGWWDAKWRIAQTLFGQRKYQQVHEMIDGDERIRPSLGGPSFKPRFLKLKQAAAQAIGTHRGDS